MMVEMNLTMKSTSSARGSYTMSIYDWLRALACEGGSILSAVVADGSTGNLHRFLQRASSR